MKGAEELLARRLCGKRGQMVDLASALAMTDDALSMVFRRLQRNGHPVRIVDHPLQGKVYSYEPRRRTCRKRGCRTHLSRYNHSDYCSLHQPKEDLPQAWFLMPNHYAKEKK